MQDKGRADTWLSTPLYIPTAEAVGPIGYLVYGNDSANKERSQERCKTASSRLLHLRTPQSQEHPCTPFRACKSVEYRVTLIVNGVKKK